MRTLGLLLILGIFLFFGWAMLNPNHEGERVIGAQSEVQVSDSAVRGPDMAERDLKEGVTLNQVAEKSKDALGTTAAYMNQERKKIQENMSVTLQKLDREIDELRTESSRTTDNRNKALLDRRLLDLEGARTNLLELRGDLGSATQSAWERLKSGWNNLESDINTRLLPDEEKEAAGAGKAH